MANHEDLEVKEEINTQQQNVTLPQIDNVDQGVCLFNPHQSGPEPSESESNTVTESHEDLELELRAGNDENIVVSASPLVKIDNEDVGESERGESEDAGGEV